MSGAHEARSTGSGPVTPILLKTSRELEWPADERVFYVLGRDGLYLCRNHEFFHSCVRTEGGPSELEEQKPFLRHRFPQIPQELFERAVGFFHRVAERQNSEAAVLLVWDRNERCVRQIVPQQTATMSRPWGGYSSPIGVHYQPPTDLPAHWVPFADIHSHVDYAAHASSTDVHDELHSAGLHIVIGRIRQEPPEIHVEAVVDGTRFLLRMEDVIEGYQRRRTDVPEAWIERVKIEIPSSDWYSGGVS